MLASNTAANRNPWGIFGPYVRTLQKGRNGHNGSTRGGWTGFGMTGARLAILSIVVSVVVIMVSVGFYTGFFNNVYLSIFPTTKPGGSGVAGTAFTPTVTGTTPPTAPGMANCNGVIYSVSGSFPSVCYASQVAVAITLHNPLGTTSASNFGANIGCRILSGGGAVPFGTQIEIDTSSSGICTTSAQQPGTPLIVEICDNSATCSSPFASQKTTTYYWLPSASQNGAGVGTVPFCGSANGCGTSSTAVTTNLYLAFQPGDGFTGQPAASATPFVFALSLPNGTILGGAAGSPVTCPSSNTVYINLAKGTQPCYLGSGVTRFSVTLTLQEPQTATAPWGAQYLSFIEADLAYKGTLTSGVTMENVLSSSSSITITGGSFQKVYTVPSSVIDFLSLNLPPDASTCIAYTSATTPTCGVPTPLSFTVSFDATGLASGGTDTVKFNFYFGFSACVYGGLNCPSGYSGGVGTANSPESQTEATQFTLTLHN